MTFILDELNGIYFTNTGEWTVSGPYLDTRENLTAEGKSLQEALKNLRQAINENKIPVLHSIHWHDHPDNRDNIILKLCPRCS